MGFVEVFLLVLQNIFWFVFGLFGFVFAYFAVKIIADLFMEYDSAVERESLFLWFVYLVCGFLLFVASLAFGISCFVIAIDILISGVW